MTAPRLCRGVCLLGVLERRCEPVVRHQVERLSIPCPLSTLVSLVPAATLDMKLLAVVTPNPVVESPTGL